MMHIPSDKKIQASRKVNRLGNRLISLRLTIPPTLLHAADSHSLSTTPPLGRAPPGSPHPAGTVKTAHHTPLRPIASLSEKVEPASKVTGAVRSVRTDTPDKKPRAVPVEDSLEVVSESNIEYCSYRSRDVFGGQAARSIGDMAVTTVWGSGTLSSDRASSKLPAGRR